MVQDILWPRATLVIWLNLSFPLTFWQGTTRTLRRVTRAEDASPGCREGWSQFYTTDSIPWFIVANFWRLRERYVERTAEASRIARAIRMTTELLAIRRAERETQN